MDFSTIEAEYVVALLCCAQLFRIKQQLKDFGIILKCFSLFFDDTSAVNMAKNPVQHKRTKNIDVRHHFLKDNVGKRLIKMVFCNTENQMAHIFTKALNRDKFERNRMKLGLIQQN